ncbi:hypothetical protein Tco_0682101 [Tanacetum coccineum]|uniref:Integrase, catalytic region, zinc finger, CCHC-type, peptidase aspartic, catalytic n=1 Tax=Tanacetum coccineum TaxID=301880 RepID=A0ABQ4XR77_9ASTR
MVIRRLKDRIKSLCGKDSLENVKKDTDEIETINIELEHTNLDLNAQLQEKVFAITALKNELKKLKGKNVVDTAVSKPNATIASGMFKLDVEPISYRLKNNRDAHEVLLVYVSQTCPKSPKPTEKLVAVTPMNKDKRVRFAEPVVQIVLWNDHIAKIMGYGDYQMGNVTVSRVYHVEGLGHNLFSVGQFCDSDLEVAFRKHCNTPIFTYSSGS